MIWNSGQPLSSSSLDSLPIRENFGFLNNTLITHASSSANPHSVSLQQATDIGASTTNPITVNASGSVFTSLLVPEDMQVEGSLIADHNTLKESSLQGGSPNEYFHLTDTEHDILVEGGDATSYHTHTAPDLDAVCIQGYSTSQPIIAEGSGSIFKSLQVQNNELIGDNLEVKGNILVDSSGSLFKSLMIGNNLQVGDDLFSKKIEHIVYAEHYASIQDALDALPSAGGVVMLPVGTTEISSTITVAPNKILRGQGEASVIKLADGANCDIIQASGDYITLEDFVVDGNISNNTLGSGIVFNGVYVYSIIKNVHSKYCAEYGMKFSNCSCVTVINCWSHHSDRHAVYVEDGSESVNFYTVVAEYVGSGYAGFYIKESGPSILDGCHAEGCDYGFKISGSFGITLESPYCAAAASGSITPVYICGSSNNISVINVNEVGTWSSGYLIEDIDRSIAIPVADITATYYSNSFHLNKYLYLYRNGATSATLYYSTGWARFEFNKDLYVNGTIESTGVGSFLGSYCVANIFRVQEYAQINSDWTSGDEDANIFFDGTFATHRAEMRYDYGLDSFYFDKAIRTAINIIADSSGSVLKSLRVQNNELIGDNLEVKGNILVDSSGSILKSLNVVNNLQVGGSIIGNVVTTDTLDTVCDRGATTDQAITVTSSGSIIKSLRVQNNELIGDNLEVKGNILVDSSGSVLKSLRVQNNLLVGGNLEVKGNILVDSSGSVLKSLRVQNNEQIGGTLEVEGNVSIKGSTLRINDAAATGCEIYFGNGSEGIAYSSVSSRFNISDPLSIDDYLLINANTPAINVSSIPAKTLIMSNTGIGAFTLQVNGDLTVGSNIAADGYLTALTSGSVLKSLRVQNNLLVGSNLEVKGSLKAIDWIELKPELAALGDGSANNAAAQLALYTSTDANDPKCRHWTLLFDATTQEHAYWQFRVPVDYVSGGRLKIQFYPVTVQTNDNQCLGMQAAMQAVTPNVDTTTMTTLDLTNDGGGWASGSYALSAATPFPAGRLCEMTLDMSSVLDSVAAGDFVELGLRRDVAKGTMIGDASIIAIHFEYNY